MEKLSLQAIIRKDMNGSSIRDYATALGVSHGTLAEVLNGKQEPTIAFLRILAEKTKRDLVSLVAFAYPDVTTGVSPVALFFAKEFELLSEETKEAILAIVQNARK